jgi:hypothetical protein
MSQKQRTLKYWGSVTDTLNTNSVLDPSIDLVPIMDLVLAALQLDIDQTVAYIESLESKNDKDIIIAIRMAHNIGLKGIR